MLLLLLGCGGPNEETLIDELRVVAMVVDPPEIAPGADAAITTYVADPLAEAPEVMLWTCTNLGDGCLEAALEDQGTTVATPVDGIVSATRTAPAELAYAVGDGEVVLPVLLWALACVPGLCPVIDLAASSPGGSSELSAFLADPFTGMEDLPLVGTSLALSTIDVSTRSEPLRNPGFASTPTEVVAAPEETVLLDFETDAYEVWGYTPGGGFVLPSYLVDGGAITMEWVAPAEAGTYAMWVVGTGLEGGTVVWTTTTTVEGG